ncbi:phosphate signaling complex protein PhoU [Gracilinema caldarium]|uniref:phosphate signaling complex protein PhoU n=1 Tax=Gracilinema caldarium TaxID=215591 RepID=UPI0026F1D16E|nr:phosphate signaling complex protein PhoU [Gracilinema caldarium]
MNIRAHFEEEKRLVREDILSMGVRVEEDLRKAIVAFKNKDMQLAKEVRDDDEVINHLQEAIEDRCARIIATQQPVAQDMRWLITSIKIADQLERIGDHAVHLAKAAIKLEKEPYIKSLDYIERMATQGANMVQGAVAAFMTLDAEKARTVATMDDGVDRDHKALVQDILDYVQKHSDKAPQGTKIIQTSGYLERLGDHVTNICEMIVYCVEGRRVELNE